MRIVLTSIDDESKAQSMAKALVELKLAACVQISAKGISIYQWQGKLCTDNEYYLSIKTDKKHVKQVISWLKDNHAYDTPEIITLKAKASQDYQQWLESSLH
jgi:periplasmic divalent cation tolerance protein